MINWLFEQQIVISFVLLTLIVLEAKAIKRLGASSLYLLWLLLPLSLAANNLPQGLVFIDDQSIYRHLVQIGASNNTVGLSFNWLWVWFAGTLIVLLKAVFTQWNIFRLTQTGSKPTRPPFALPKTLTVVSNNQLSGPILSGIFKPTLLLPEQFEEHFSPRQQQLMIRHELVHFHRGDNIYNLLALMFVAVFWFNPLSWMAYRAFRRSQELACDATVLKASTLEDKITYSKALVECAQHSLHSFAIYSPYGEKHNMLKRIASIQNQSHIKPAFVGLTIALGSVVISGIALANMAETTHKVVEVVGYRLMASPVLRIEPKYPVQAAQDRIEGSTILQFDIAKDGTTDNIKVIESFSQQVFDKVSITALEQWKYKPRIQGGQAQRQTGLKVQLDFRMDKPYEGQTAKTTQIEKIKVQH